MKFNNPFKKVAPVTPPQDVAPAAPAEPEPLYKIVKRTDDGRSTVWMLDPVTGDGLVTDDSNVMFDEIVTRLTTGKSTGEALTPVPLRSMFDPQFAAQRLFARVSERVTVAHGDVLFDGDVVTGPLAEAVLRSLGEGADDFAPLVKFMENLYDNPIRNSREQLFPWLAKGGYSIDKDGFMLAYKGARANDEDGLLYSTSSGTATVDGVLYEDSYIPNYVGATVTMPRSTVDADTRRECSTGLHAGRFNYAKGYGTVMLVRINPRDVVSVPMGDTEKIRCCRYTVLALVDSELNTVMADSVSIREDADRSMAVTR